MKALGLLAALLLAAFLFRSWSLAAAGLWLEFWVLAVSSFVTLAAYGLLEERSL